ncbi:2Fe-2S iron-sulfur cluster binding domain-containing protein [Croceicoccus ponticola]|uniref:2Fe-2S iron-sulfur cluster binding domain-containing protein n=1 Tax=Croceicoccus ponticola TaxID=2217664 RepID=A0A437GU33_9SPHN|nr:2Fe-2S iron-sulfur cluster-binding protein [Croceicoccus ponticola]RVQ64747.1 2Fe-2S iron-sulfur cluster binding domain-containing protein [Croceicoccus ponticola]
MVRVTFKTAEGRKVEADAAQGDTLLSAGQAIGMPLEGTCEGQMACSTCHVVVAPEWFGKLAAATDDEEDMLDLAAGVEGTSRLSCQIVLTPELDGIEVSIPAHVHNVRRD